MVDGHDISAPEPRRFHGVRSILADHERRIAEMEHLLAPMSAEDPEPQPSDPPGDPLPPWRVEPPPAFDAGWWYGAEAPGRAFDSALDCARFAAKKHAPKAYRDGEVAECCIWGDPSLGAPVDAFVEGGWVRRPMEACVAELPHEAGWRQTGDPRFYVFSPYRRVPRKDAPGPCPFQRGQWMVEGVRGAVTELEARDITRERYPGAAYLDTGEGKEWVWRPENAVVDFCPTAIAVEHTSADAEEESNYSKSSNSWEERCQRRGVPFEPGDEGRGLGERNSCDGPAPAGAEEESPEDQAKTILDLRAQRRELRDRVRNQASAIAKLQAELPSPGVRLSPEDAERCAKRLRQLSERTWTEAYRVSFQRGARALEALSTGEAEDRDPNMVGRVLHLTINGERESFEIPDATLGTGEAESGGAKRIGAGEYLEARAALHKAASERDALRLALGEAAAELDTVRASAAEIMRAILRCGTCTLLAHRGDEREDEGRGKRVYSSAWLAGGAAGVGWGSSPLEGGWGS